MRIKKCVDFDAAKATDSFFYNVGFGIEGSLLAAVLTIAGCVILVIWGRKHGRKPLDVWEEKEISE